ncbi:unnamed protein product [Euphydryas editha]|uniref:JH-inducible protein n=1 Tax=Euphydryas editha TaxID=104508 RepID=A0AAU9TBY6_EUPED|nr:unnamed protein product [Euphydryas editha]
MDKSRQIIGSATRYIAGRHAVQTVYWRASENGKGLMKTTKMIFFGKNEGSNKVGSAEMFAKVRERYL